MSLGGRDLIKVRRGTSEDLLGATVQEGEIVFTDDDEALHIGKKDGTTARFPGGKELARLNLERVEVERVLMTKLDNKQDKYRQVTLTLSGGGWTIAPPCSQTVTVLGMTVDALVWVEFSDRSREFNVIQGAGSLTFETDSVPSEDITVKVGWLK